MEKTEFKEQKGERFGCEKGLKRTKKRNNMVKTRKTEVIEQKTNTLAILGFILSFIIPLLGLIFSIISLNQIKSNKEEKGKGLAIAGLIISIMGCIFLIVILISLGLESNNATNPTSNNDNPSLNQVTQQTEPKTLITKSPMEMLPTREEIDTEWGHIQREDRVIDASGFNSGASLDMDRMESVSLSTAYILVMKFDSKDYADLFYFDAINKVKEEGGYTEMSTSGIDATCFGHKGSNPYEGYRYSFYCEKGNIFFLTEVKTFSAWRSGYSEELAKIVANKI